MNPNEQDDFGIISSSINSLKEILKRDMREEKKEDMKEDTKEDMKKDIAINNWQESYSCCHRICGGHGNNEEIERLHRLYKSEIDDFLVRDVGPILESKIGLELIEEFAKRWNHHKTMSRWMKRLFHQLGVRYIRANGKDSLEKQALDSFRDCVIITHHERLSTAFFEHITNIREGKDGSGDLKKSIYAYIAVDNNIYCENFEEFLLAESKEYFERSSREWIEKMSVPEYLIQAERALAREKFLARQYLKPSSEPKLLALIDKHVLEDRLNKILTKDTDFSDMLYNSLIEDLQRLYALYSRIPHTFERIAEKLKEKIESDGKAIIDERRARIDEEQKENADDPEFVKSLIELLEKYTRILKNAFQENIDFNRAHNAGFENVLKYKCGKISITELLATFCDRILKKGGDTLTEKQFEHYQDQVISLYGYLQDKDLFGEIYRNALGKRLLNERSCSDDAEKSTISKLKSHSGCQFTSRMEGMINDLKIASDTQEEFKRYANERRSRLFGVDFSVQVLTTGNWPSNKMVDFRIPASLSSCIDLFKEFYESKNPERRLIWVHPLGSMTIRAKFGSKTYELYVVTLQGCVLLHFNNPSSEFLSFDDLHSLTGIEEEVLKRTLHSLSCRKYKLLTKTPESNKVNRQDQFCVNSRFQSSKRKLRITMVSLDESHNPQRVEEDRSIAIEAAIVRIMKARRSLSHVQLVNEILIQLLLFKPDPKIVKRRIENLIERGYLERDPENPSSYRYLA